MSARRRRRRPNIQTMLTHRFPVNITPKLQKSGSRGGDCREVLSFQLANSRLRLGAQCNNDRIPGPRKAASTGGLKELNIRAVSC